MSQMYGEKRLQRIAPHPPPPRRTWEWPCLTSTHSYSFPGMDSQIHTLLSRPHVDRNDPSGLHATHLTSFSCPSRVAT